jgi:putative endonuclease
MGWWVYVIECGSGAWYTGVSTDPERRFAEHAAGKGAKFMRMDPPRRIVAVQACGSKGEALSLEAAIKRLSREEKQGWAVAHPYVSRP